MLSRKSQQIEDLRRQLEEARAARLAAEEILERAGGRDASHVQRLVRDLHGQREALQREIDGRREAERREIQEVQHAIFQARNHLAQIQQQTAALNASYQDAATMLDYGLVDYAHPARSSVQLQSELAGVRSRIKEMVRTRTATLATTNFTFNNSTAKGRKFISDMSKMMLRSYNAEAENCILTLKAGNGQAAVTRLERAREQVKRLGAMIDLRIADEYHRLRLRELELALHHKNAVKVEKEIEREEKARLREEAKARKELEEQREKLLKERGHYENVVNALLSQGKAEEAREIQAKIDDIDSQIENVDFRAANIRAGYVYVISNIGSFGREMVKIGMTRRLVPEDRVRELSGVSVPFNFDVHALFFTEDAVTVEAELHRRFADKRVNLVNRRREFFAVSPADVKRALKEIAGNLLEFVEEPEAEQYRLSCQMRAAENRPVSAPSFAPGPQTAFSPQLLARATPDHAVPGRHRRPE